MANYNTLGSYNSFGNLSAGVNPPLPAGTPSMAIQMVPVYGMPGYEALTHGNRGNGSGYFSIGSAYPDYPVRCDAMSPRACDGFLSDGYGNSR